MQRILIHGYGEFILEGFTLPYSAYFVEGPSYDRLTTEEAFKEILLRWAIALTRNKDNEQFMYFPFLPDDEYTEVFRGIINGKSVELSRGIIGLPGYELDYESLESFIVSPCELFPDIEMDRRPAFSEIEGANAIRLVVDIEEFIAELKQPVIVEMSGSDLKQREDDRPR